MNENQRTDMIQAANSANQAALLTKFATPMNAADTVATIIALSSIPDAGDGLNIWVERNTDDQSGYFKKNQSFPLNTVTDPGAGFMFTENLQTTRENLTSSAYSSQVGNYVVPIAQSPSMDLLIGKITTCFSTDTLNVTSNINVEYSYDTVLPASPEIILTTITAFWRGMVVTGNGQVPELDFYPFLPTFDMTGFAATGVVNKLQPFIYRPLLLPCSRIITLAGPSGAGNLKLNETKVVSMSMTTSNPNLRTDIRLVTGSSNDMVSLQKEMLAFKANSAVAALPSR